MKEKKERIAAFIESLEGKPVVENSVLLGGYTKMEDKEWASSNSGSCTNRSRGACESSTNGGNCKNEVEMCDNSTNRGSGCTNSLAPLS